MPIKVTTNGHARPLMSINDIERVLTAEAFQEFKDSFDYIEFDPVADDYYSPRFVRAYGNWYDTHDVQRIESSLNPSGMRTPFSFVADPSHPLHGWDAISTDSAFSGVVFRVVWDDSDDAQIVVGTYSE